MCRERRNYARENYQSRWISNEVGRENDSKENHKEKGTETIKFIESNRTRMAPNWKTSKRCKKTLQWDRPALGTVGGILKQGGKKK